MVCTFIHEVKQKEICEVDLWGKSTKYTLCVSPVLSDVELMIEQTFSCFFLRLRHKFTERCRIKT
jgi:hypothetical protein